MTDAAVTEGRPLRFWVTAAIGAAGIAWGLRGIFTHSLDTRPGNLAKFFIGDVVIHDAIWAPLVLAGGLVVARVVPAAARAWVQAAVIVCGSLALFAYPEIRDFAAPQQNPTSLPLNYTATTAGAVVAVCVAVALAAVAHRLVLRRRA